MEPCETGKKIVNKIVEDNQGAILVAGVINASGKMLYWKSDIDVEIGEYAIVENATGFDLIRIVGLVVINKKSAGRFSNTNYENMKKVVMNIGKLD